MKRTHGTVINTIRLPITLNKTRTRVGLSWNDAIALGVKLAAAQHDDFLSAHGPEQGYKQFREWLDTILQK